MRLLILTQKVDQTDDVLGFVHGWIEEFAKHCDEVTVIALGVGTHTLPSNVRVFSLGKERGVSRSAYLTNFYQLIVRERAHYDAVFVHMNPEYVILGGILWKMMGKKIGLWYTHKNVDWRLRLAVHGADIIFTASSESFRMKTSKLEVTGHGIDMTRFEALTHEPSDTFRILTIGRISPSKGYGTLLDALDLLKKNGQYFRATIVGAPATEDDATYLNVLRSKVAEYGLAEAVTFAGKVAHNDIGKYLSTADCFVNMSETGSLDKAVLEAMAAGVPVLTSNEGLRSTLASVREETMFEAGNKERFADKLAKMIALGNDGRQKLGVDLRKIAKTDHDLSKLIPRILSELC